MEGRTGATRPKLRSVPKDPGKFASAKGIAASVQGVRGAS